MNVFITGVSSGIGLDLTKLALKAGHHVYGVARNPEKSVELMALKSSNPSLQLLELDLMEEKASEKIASFLKNCPDLGLVINNAGVYEKGNSKEEFYKTFEVNTFIPFMVTEAVLPKLKSGSSPKLIHISSLMGSIEDNSSGGSYFYRASKTALNMINKCLTVENEWLITAVVHPGWVQTKMGGTEAPLSVQDSTAGIWKVIQGLSKSGSFVDYQGRELPW